MADDTTVDVSPITKAATAINDIMADGRLDKFDALIRQWPNAGQYDTAQWLERVVDDRRNALVEQGNRLNLIFSDMANKLTTVANDLSQTDADNANTMQDVKDMIGDITGDVTTYDENTEFGASGDPGQHNFSPQPHDTTAGSGSDKQTPQQNANDGDGYDDDDAPAG